MSENKKKKVKKERKHTIEGKNNKKPDHKKLDHKKLDHKKLDRKKARKRLKKIEEQVELLSIPSKNKRALRRDKQKAPDGDSEPKITEPPQHPFRTNLKEFDALHQHDELDDREEFNLFGDNLPLLDRKFEARVLFNTPNNDLPKGYVFEGNGCSYKIVKELGVGLNYYKVNQRKTDLNFIVKFESTNIIKRTSRLGCEVHFMKNVRRVDKRFSEHFLCMVDRGRVGTKYNFLVSQLGGPNLLDERIRIDGQFLPCDAVRLCMQTLQAVHDVHLCHFVHRDIQPKNFVVGNGGTSIVYMVNFGLSFQYFPNHDRQLSIPAKFTWLSQTFQARAFHKGHEYKRWDEMESWLYLCYWFFDGFCLPWLDASCEEELGDTTERQICNFKDLFFVGAYDQDMSQYSRRYLPTSLRTMRNKVNFDLICGDRSMINYPFYARAIMEMVNEIKVDWSAPYQWQLEQEDLKPVESFIKHGSHLEGNVCIACENSLLAKQALNEAWKPSEPKIEKNKKSTKKKKPIVEDSESDSSTSSKQVKNNSSVDTNEID